MHDGKRTSVTIMGDVSGQVAIGDSIEQVVSMATPNGGDADRSAARRRIGEVRSMVARSAAPQVRDGALERFDDLGRAVLDGEPDVEAIGYVCRWFTRNAPELAAIVAGLFVDQAVARVVDRARPGLAGELGRGAEG